MSTVPTITRTIPLLALKERLRGDQDWSPATTTRQLTLSYSREQPLAVQLNLASINWATKIMPWTWTISLEHLDALIQRDVPTETSGLNIRSKGLRRSRRRLIIRLTEFDPANKAKRQWVEFEISRKAVEALYAKIAEVRPDPEATGQILDHKLDAELAALLGND